MADEPVGDVPAAGPSLVVDKGVPCRLRDGTVLRGDVYRPADDGRHPVLLLRTPYNKDFPPLAHLALDPLRAAAAGFAVVVQDVRGRWASEGSFAPYAAEFEDGADAVAWAASQPWSDGNVGTYGVSYMGATAWHAAASGHSAVRAVVAAQAPNDPFVNLSWRGGAFLWGTHVLWSLLSIGMSEIVRRAPRDPAVLSAVLPVVDALDGFEAAVRHLPPCTFPAARPDDPFAPFFFEELDHPTRDEHHVRRSMHGRHREVAAPALIVAGWHDTMLAADLEHHAAMRSGGATPEARDGTRLLVGPWSHGLFANVVGEHDFGVRASGVSLDLREDVTALHLRWFSSWLRDGPPIEDAPVRIFVQGVDRWRDEDAWPLARTRPERWHLHTGGRLAPRPPAADDPPSAYVYDPLDPCPTTGGALLLPRTYVPGPVDQARILDRRDVLVYTSAPLQADLELTGPVRAVLHASTTAADADWVVKLCEVDERGRAVNICDGILRARYRRSWEAPELVEPGAVERYEVDLWSTSIVVRAGRRLAVLVTSSDFPRYDRNPGTGALGVDATSTTPSLQRVFSDAGRPSYVELPVVPVT